LAYSYAIVSFSSSPYESESFFCFFDFYACSFNQAIAKAKGLTGRALTIA